MRIDSGAARIKSGALRIGFPTVRSGSAAIPPLAYATDVITKLQRGWPKSRIEELLPDLWTPSDVELAAE